MTTSELTSRSSARTATSITQTGCRSQLEWAAAPSRERSAARSNRTTGSTRLAWRLAMHCRAGEWLSEAKPRPGPSPRGYPDARFCPERRHKPDASLATTRLARCRCSPRTAVSPRLPERHLSGSHRRAPQSSASTRSLAADRLTGGPAHAWFSRLGGLARGAARYASRHESKSPAGENRRKEGTRHRGPGSDARPSFPACSPGRPSGH